MSLLDSKIAFLENLLGEGAYSRNSKEFGVFCPFCSHHKKKLFINLETDRWHCWVCSKAGKNLLYLLKRVGTKLDVDTYLKKYKAKDVEIKSVDLKTFSISLPEDFKPLVDCMDTVYGQRVFKYLSKRGISEDDVLRHKIGVSFSKKYYDRVILPSFNKDGFLNFYTARTINPEIKFGKYADPDDLPSDYKTQIIMNELNIDWSKPVVLTEGAFDAIKGFNTVPLFGSYLSPDYEVFRKIVIEKSEVVLALDADARKKALQMAETLMRRDVLVYMLDVSPYNDLGEMTKEDFLERYNAAELVTPEFIFKEKLRAVCG